MQIAKTTEKGHAGPGGGCSWNMNVSGRSQRWRFALQMQMQEQIHHEWGRCQEGSLVCRSRAGKRQGHGSVQVTHTTPGNQDVPMGRVCCS